MEPLAGTPVMGMGMGSSSLGVLRHVACLVLRLAGRSRRLAPLPLCSSRNRHPTPSFRSPASCPSRLPPPRWRHAHRFLPRPTVRPPLPPALPARVPPVCPQLYLMLLVRLRPLPVLRRTHHSVHGGHGGRARARARRAGRLTDGWPRSSTAHPQRIRGAISGGNLSCGTGARGRRAAAPACSAGPALAAVLGALESGTNCAVRSTVTELLLPVRVCCVLRGRAGGQGWVGKHMVIQEPVSGGCAVTPPPLVSRCSGRPHCSASVHLASSKMYCTAGR